jgi:CheY-like chemotaxis protein
MLPGPGPAAAVAAASRVEAGSARVFVAEDDPLVAKTVTTALRRAYRNVVHFPDGAAAWQHLQSHLRDYDLLLLDVNMPGLDGIELAQRVRTTGRFDGRIVIISGRLGSEDLEQISRARIDCVLSKPFEVAELLGAVRDVLQTEPKR